jgi:hypothetical protein
MICDDSGLLLQLIQALNQKSNPKQPYHCTNKILITYVIVPVRPFSKCSILLRDQSHFYSTSDQVKSEM